MSIREISLPCDDEVNEAEELLSSFVKNRE